MAEPRQIMCIARTDSTEAHDRIAQVGWPNTDGTLWKMTIAEAIAAAEAGHCKCYASVWGRPVWVVVAANERGDQYLKTETDGVLPNNLLTIPECP